VGRRKGVVRLKKRSEGKRADQKDQVQLVWQAEKCG
jgi:hypothetical protein